jgi:L-threonylcarbamoyladenylate synthase
MTAEPATSDSLDDALAALRRGAVIAVSTDTVHGLACDPRDPLAVDRVYAIKRRPRDLELTLLAASREDLEGFVQWTPTADRLAGALWPGPLSLVLPVGERRLSVPRQGTTLSVRVPGHALLRELLRHSGPLATTSANRHGDPPVADVAGLREEFNGEVGAVLSGGHPGGIASTIIDCSVAPARVLREGPIESRRLMELLHG